MTARVAVVPQDIGEPIVSNKIRIINGDLVAMCAEGHFQSMIHGCNCFHAMGSGIAGQLARIYPEVPQADINGSKFGDFTKIGSYTKVLTTDGFVVYNAYTQKAPSYDGEDVFEYQGFREVLRKIQEDIHLIQPLDVHRLGLPFIGAGLAGGDWDRIEGIINEVLADDALIETTIIHYDPRWTTNVFNLDGSPVKN